MPSSEYTLAEWLFYSYYVRPCFCTPPCLDGLLGCFSSCLVLFVWLFVWLHVLYV